jgi:hypothetical protein
MILSLYTLFRSELEVPMRALINKLSLRTLGAIDHSIPRLWTWRKTMHCESSVNSPAQVFIFFSASFCKETLVPQCLCCNLAQSCTLCISASFRGGEFVALIHDPQLLVARALYNMSNDNSEGGSHFSVPPHKIDQHSNSVWHKILTDCSYRLAVMSHDSLPGFHLESPPSPSSKACLRPLVLTGGGFHFDWPPSPSIAITPNRFYSLAYNLLEVR